MSHAGAGRVGGSFQYSFMSEGEGRWYEMSKDKTGLYKQTDFGPEVRIETVVARNCIKETIMAVRKVHPYKEMGYDIIPLKHVTISFSLPSGMLSANGNKDPADQLKKQIYTPVLEDGVLEASNKVKLVVFLPKKWDPETNKYYPDLVREALGQEEAGRIGNYSHCSFMSEAEGRWYEITEETPKVYQQKDFTPVRIETVVELNRIKETIIAVSKVHPYKKTGHDIICAVTPLLKLKEDSQ